MKTRMTTKVICLFGIMFLLVLLTLQAQVKAGITMEDNTDRPGQDYKNFELDTPDPELCQEACANDPNCQAYTYVKPGIQGAKARCWLKKTVPPARNNNCCVSGVKTAQADIPKSPQGGGSWGISPSVSLEPDTNRPGKDYKNFELDTPDPGLCQKACADDPNCQAYTYVKPGIQGAKARCWLKKTVPPAQSNNCCVSGVKGAQTAPPEPSPKADDGVNSYCKNYADTAMKQINQRIDNDCEPIDPLEEMWKPDYDHHYNHCLGVEKDILDSITLMREQWLDAYCPTTGQQQTSPTVSTPDIDGKWRSSTGEEYVVTQRGNHFTFWRAHIPTEISLGDIEGTKISITSIGLSGHRTLSGTTKGTGYGNKANRIDWNDNTVWTR